MLFNNQETTRALTIIQRGAEQWTAEELEVVLRLARARRPATLTTNSLATEKRYEGDQAELVKAALTQRYPRTNLDTMPISPVNWLKSIARNDAGVYAAKASRWLEDDAGERIPKDDPRSLLWKKCLRRGLVNTAMREVERRMLLPPGCTIGGIDYDVLKKRLVFLHIFPHDVELLCHTDAPTDWNAAYVFMVRKATPDATSTSDWWQVWSRVPPDRLDGEWGPWSFTLMAANGKHKSLPVPWKGKVLPYFVAQIGTPRGYALVNRDADLHLNVDDLNARRSNEGFVEGLQGHDEKWTDSFKEAHEIKGGPDAMHQVLPGQQVGILSPNPKLTDMREGREQSLRELAQSRGNVPTAYQTKVPTVPPSGVALRIGNLSHDQHVDELAEVMQFIEEEVVLPIALDVLVAFDPEGEQLAGCAARMAPRKMMTLEEPNQRQQRMERAADRGWQTEAQAAARSELYDDEDEAEEGLAEIEATAGAGGDNGGDNGGGPPPPPPPGGGNANGGLTGSKDPLKSGGGSGGADGGG